MLQLSGFYFIFHDRTAPKFKPDWPQQWGARPALRMHQLAT